MDGRVGDDREDTALSAALASVVLAVDGPSGSGKSSVSRGVATRLGLRYLDTGAMYRAITWWMLTHHVDVADADAVEEHAYDPQLVLSSDPASTAVAVDGVDVSGPIRGAAVTAAVSAVSAVPVVRARLLIEQRLAAAGGGIVVEGRDIGTVVLPNATLKIFLTARPEVRSARRARELDQTGLGDPDPLVTLESIQRRDHLDSTRATSPLVQAADAVEIDATDLSLDEVIDRVVELLRGRVLSSAAGTP